MDNKSKIIFIHGGSTFRDRDGYLDFLRNRKIRLGKRIKWCDDYLDRELENISQLIKPRMPLREDAKYEDWKIHFERYVDLLEDNAILVGYSLGGIFLAKYLSENRLPKKVLSVYLIAPPFDDSLPDEDLVGGFELKNDLSLIKENCEKINFMFSSDDACVPLSQSEKYKEKLKDVNFLVYDDKEGHFGAAEFPELIEMIKKDLDSTLNQ